MKLRNGSLGRPRLIAGRLVAATASSVIATRLAASACVAQAGGPAQPTPPAGPIAYPPPTHLSPRDRLRNRVRLTAYVTAVECGGLYAWLRLSRRGHPKVGAVCLVLEESLESGLLLLIFVQGAQDKALVDDPTVAKHLQRAQTASACAINAEIMIWLLWLSLAEKVPSPLAGAFLAISMHLKHQLEAATVLDTTFREQFSSPTVVVGSVSEVIGAIASLQLLRAARPRPAAAALVAGIGFEHILFINEVQREMETRDICLPKPRRSGA